MSWGEDFEYFDFEYLHYTGSAVLFNNDGDDIWIPRSVIEDDSDYDGTLDRGSPTNVGIRIWWCKKNDLI